MGTLRGIPLELGCERSVSAYGDDVTIIVLSNRHIEVVIKTNEYNTVTRVKANLEKSVGL